MRRSLILYHPKHSAQTATSRTIQHDHNHYTFLSLVTRILPIQWIQFQQPNPCSSSTIAPRNARQHHRRNVQSSFKHETGSMRKCRLRTLRRYLLHTLHIELKLEIGFNEVCCPAGGMCCIDLTTETGSCCSAGEACCSSISCYPLDAECCSDGSYCASGTYCCAGGCCHSTTSDVGLSGRDKRTGAMVLMMLPFIIKFIGDVVFY
jgi:hypothetical protein